MKHPRLILWYLMLIPTFVVFFATNLLETICVLFIAAHRVLEVLAFRFEMWAKYNEKGSIVNCPWKMTLAEHFVDALENRK